MAGYDYTAGRSNNMVAAEEAGLMTIGRWGRRRGVSAAAVLAVMHPAEAHHTGTGRRGTTRLTYVLPRAKEPTAEQLAAMRAWDAGDRPPVRGWYVAWRREYGRYGRRHNVPTLGVYLGDPASAPRRLSPLSEEEYARSLDLAGRRLAPYATRYDEICPT